MFITVFTPTYNRARTLPRLYESLLQQEFREFEWLVIDDGSNDNTRDLIGQWIAEGHVQIRYVYQENGGMLAAHNRAFDNVKSELVTCVDSDDFLVSNALTQISDAWRSLGADPSIVGLVGLDVKLDGEVLGDAFPVGLARATFKEIRFKHGLRGDKKYVFRTDAVQRAGRYPVVLGEKYPAASYLYRLVDRQGVLAIINKPLCVVEYQDDGNSKQKFRQYRTNPNAFMEFRSFCMSDAYDAKELLLSAVHFVSACIFARRYAKVIFNRHAHLTIPALPLGLALNIFLRSTSRKGLVS